MIRHPFLRWAWILVLLTSAGSPLSRAQQENPIRWTLEMQGRASALRRGAGFNVALTAHISEGWHLYAETQQVDLAVIPTKISVTPGQDFRLQGTVQAPTPQVAWDPNFEVDTQFYEGSPVFMIPVAVVPNAKFGKHKLTINIFYQTCNAQFCLPPRTDSTEIELTIEQGPAAAISSPPSAAALAPERDEETMNRAVVQGTAEKAPAKTAPVRQSPRQPLGSFLWLAAGMGALSLLTPCVFPMIPITVSYFTKHAANSRGAAVRRAFVYAIGIILTFTALGLALALAFGAAGVNQLAANPWVNLLITAIFVGFALSLFGDYSLQVPSKFVNKIDALARNPATGETIGALLMGLTFTLTSFTCTSPFVGTLLVMAAQGSWRWPVMGMLAFSTVFALPFFVLALMPQFLAQLPKSGNWLNSVKVVMGFLEIAAAMKFLSNVDLVWGWNIFTREVVIAVWIAIGLLTALYLVGGIRMAHETPIQNISSVRAILAIVSLTLTVWLGTGLLGTPLGEIESFLPPASDKGGSGTSVATKAAGSESGEFSWILNDFESALAQARSQGKLVFVNFTGYTCTNCRWMEKNMFPRPDVSEELKKFVRVELYTDRAGEVYERQQKMEKDLFGTVALPYYAILTSTGNPVAEFPGLTRSSAEFVQFLKKGSIPSR